MLRTTLDKAYIKRTIRPLYGWTQATPSDMKLDTEVDISGFPVFPGMVAERTAGQQVTLLGNAGTAADSLPYGLFGLYIGGEGIDEVADSTVNSVGVWVLAPDAQFEVQAPAFDDSVAWDDTGETLVHAWVSGDGRGQLVPAGATKAGHVISTQPVARLIEVVSDYSIIIGGLAVRA